VSFAQEFLDRGGCKRWDAFEGN